MTLSPRQRRWALVLGTLLLLVLAALTALRILVQQLPARVAQALGPRATVGAIDLAWRGVEVRELVLRAAPGQWPAAEELRAERVLIRPTLSSLLGGRLDIARITVEGGQVSLLRTREGRLLVVPSLLGRGGAGASKTGPGLHLRIDQVSLRDVTLEFFDASITRGAPHRIRLAELRADVGPLAMPALDEPIAVDIAAVFKGPLRDGRLSLAGALTPATRDADLKLDARGVDLTALQPYLLRSGESAIKAGTLDLSLRAKAAQQRLNAPGRLTLSGLELQSGGGVLGTFGGVPKQAVLAAMSRDGRIELDFTLEGRVDDPKFSINELFAARFAVGLAEKLGITLGGVVEGVGGLIKGLLGR